MPPLLLNRLLMLQMVYASAGIIYNVGGLLAVRNDLAAWASGTVAIGLDLGGSRRHQRLRSDTQSGSCSGLVHPKKPAHHLR